MRAKNIVFLFVVTLVISIGLSASAGAAKADQASILGDEWTDCTSSHIGANLISWATDDFDDTTGPELVNLAQDGIPGLAGATTYTDGINYFPSLVGWEKAHLCNSHQCMETRIANSLRDGLAYDYLGYGPERLGGVPDEEKYNLPWATEVAGQIVNGAGKKLMLSYSTKQLHQEALERGFGWENAGEVVKLLAPHGDLWMIQAADEYNNPNNQDYGSYGPILSQRHYPPGPEWRSEVERWVNWIRDANPEIEIWIQLALHRIGVQEDNYPSAELTLEYREWLVNPEYGPPLIDGIYMTSTYSWPIDSLVADEEMEKVFRYACAGAAPEPSPTPVDTPIFVDVPFDHPYNEEIETLYRAGYTSGCNTDPLMYCPEEAMTRAESAVFVERGVHSADYVPSDPTQQIFSDVSLSEWYAKWATGLWQDGYTDGCGTDPLVYCPLQEHIRAEGAVFYLRMLYGADYTPPDPIGIFDDVPLDTWYAKWVEAAYSAALIEPCETSPLRYCPEAPLTRAVAAYMMVQAKDVIPGPEPTETPGPSPTPSPTSTPSPTPSDTPTPLSMTLIEEGDTEGFHYWLYENPRYPCGGGDGNHEFLVLQKGTAKDERNLLVNHPGGAVGFYYNDESGQRVYYPHQNAVGLLLARYNRNMMFRVALKDGLAKRFRERDDFRLMVPSYCSHDLYYGTGEYSAVDGFSRWGHLAANEAVDFVEQSFLTNKIITSGGSAGASGSFNTGIAQEKVVGIIMDSFAGDLSGIRDACLDGQYVFGSLHPCFCPAGSGILCMEVLASRIGFSLGADEPYVLVNRGLVETPIFLIWNQSDGSQYAYRHYQNLHDALETVNPGGNSVAKMVCIDDPDVPGDNTCNLHVPTTYEYENTIPLIDEVYEWALSLLN
jgi:hypothetical protein